MDPDATALLAYLDQGRRHVLGIVEGLGDDDLQRAVLPSGWTCLGLVHHLAVDVERFWFRAVQSGDAEAWASFDDTESAWNVAAGTPPATVLALYRAEIEAANAVIASTPLDTAPVAWPDMFGSFRLDNLREILLHVITETACHAGHLDAARELIDGRQWMVL